MFLAKPLKKFLARYTIPNAIPLPANHCVIEKILLHVYRWKMTNPPEQCPSVHKWIVFLGQILTLAYLIAVCIHFSSRQVMWLDEFFSWNLLTDRSLVHALGAWGHGADSGGPLYYIVGWLLVRLTGPSVLAVRLFSAVCLGLASVLYWKLLARMFSGMAAFIGIFLIWCSHELLIRVSEARFYGFYVLVAVVAIYATLFSVDRETQPLKAFFICLGAHAALLGSHIMGIVYSGLILVAVLSGKRSKKQLAAAAGIVSSWSVLIFFRKAIYYGSGNAPVADKPTLLNLTEYYHFPDSLSLAILGLLAVLTASIILLYFFRGKNTESSPSTLIKISILFYFSPLFFYVLSIWKQPVFSSRYMYPNMLAFAAFGCVLAWLFFRIPTLEKNPALRYGVFSILIALLAVRHYKELSSSVPIRALPDIAAIQRSDNGLPIVCPNAGLFFDLAYYYQRPDFHVYFLSTLNAAMHRNPNGPLGIMETIQQHGYWPGQIQDASYFIENHNSFMYLDFPAQEGFRHAYLGGPDWHVEKLGSILSLDGPADIVRYDRIKH